jgi:hypothetical protein
MTPGEEARVVRASEAGRAAAAAAKRGATSFTSRVKYSSHDDLEATRPQPSLEAARHRAVAALASKFEAAAGHVLGGRWWSHYESWLFSRRAAGATAAAKAGKGKRLSGAGAFVDAPAAAAPDPVVPDPTLARTDPELMRKLVAAGLSDFEARGVCMDIGRAAAKAAAQAQHEGGGGGGGAAGNNKHVKLTRFEIGGKGGADYSGSADERGEGAGGRAAAGGASKAQLTCGKVKLEINATHLEKLRALHRRYADTAGGGGGGGGKHRDGDTARMFKDSVFCLLARYSALQGAHYKAGAMQAALPPQCFDALRAEFDVCLELCASPFNCHFRRYCSAFLDTDAAFGSLGDCFQFHPVEGSFEGKTLHAKYSTTKPLTLKP